jgi:hypothetical protein
MIGVCAMFIFEIIYDWDDFEKGLKGTSPNDTAKVELVK